jgi:hypothetical protein
MSKRDRRDGDRRDYERRDYERRDSQPDDEQQRRAGEIDLQESDSLTALKAILSKVSALLKPLQLTSDEAIKLVEQLYGSVLDTDVKLAGEADETRKASVLAHVQNTNIRRDGSKLVVEYPPADALQPPTPPAGEGEPAPKADISRAANTPPPRRPRETAKSPQPRRTGSADAGEAAPPADTLGTADASAAAEAPPED